MSRYMGKEYNREFIYIMEKRNFGTSRKKGGKGKFGVFGKWKKGVSESAPDPPMPDSRIRGSTVRWFRTVALLPGNPAPRFHTNQDSRLQQNSETGIPGVRGSRLPGFPATAKPGVRGSRDHGITGSRDHGITGSRDHGITGSRDHGITGSRDHGIRPQPQNAVSCAWDGPSRAFCIRVG